MPKTAQGSTMEHTTATLTLTGGESESVTVTFREAYTSIPAVFAVHHLGDEEAEITVEDITASSCSVQISGSSLPDGAAVLELVVHEKS